MLGPLAGIFSGVDRRKFSLDMDYKEKVRNQDLKNILKTKLQAWLVQPNHLSRQVALGIKTQPKRQVIKEDSRNMTYMNRKEFVSPKPISNEIGRSSDMFKNVSPLLLP